MSIHEGECSPDIRQKLIPTMFLTLEDETGLANIIVPRDTVQEYWATACNYPYVRGEGIVEKDGGVIHLLAKRIFPLTVSAAIAPSHDFH
jgi:error-prone DNA polymerase